MSEKLDYIGNNIRKVIYFIIILCIQIEIFGQSVSSCNPIQKDFEHNNTTILESKEVVVLKPGFSYKAEGTDYFRAFVNPNLNCTITSTEDTENPYTHTTAFAVGATAGVADVSSTGTATYEIPIYISPGINGVEPNISIVYNSQSGSGLLGQSWHLKVNSKIELSPNIYYYDGFNESIKPTTWVTDLSHTNLYQTRFSLDGNRLILVSGTNAEDNSEYRTTNESFKKIIYHKSGNNNYFELRDKSGLIYYYGQSENSRTGNSSSIILSWCLNRVEDKTGNYITYEYNTTNGMAVTEKPI
ncbi:MAG: hypothetical protein LBV69_08875, partial [Bacteroidales bacterium]|nr:hypothetical protein [Bacteroidales bacterium]